MVFGLELRLMVLLMQFFVGIGNIVVFGLGLRLSFFCRDRYWN